ncbi:uncharacterized protein CTRU02_206930 [Colletotrichum truncatum]|uniref:Uncharacterized protein n=1 Tax=Colletotrichum truncatum TaxID=5467 RepID=A0ACC3YZ67_COLTU|nr:uncharacterized protein CTRU02_11215 [Colletotrichum truncatum]KAF6786344.1 hypothetical protein CTRU02_11215 [Colletotrichum truncatum]
MYQHVNRATSDQPPPEIEEHRHAVSQQDTDYDEPAQQYNRPYNVAKNRAPVRPNTNPRRLSFLLILSIFVSLLSIACAVSFVSWLWWTSHKDDRWRAWVLIPNRLQIGITVASVIIRTAVGTLAAIATAMIASVAVERRGVDLHAVAQVSIARFSSSGPLTLGLLALRSSTLAVVVRVIVVLLILSTFAVQFTSTLLLSDLEQSQIASFTQPMDNAYTFAGKLGSTTFPREDVFLGYDNGLWGQRPQIAETFAEYSADSLASEGLDDTGPTVRAFLPIASQETRQSIVEYQGMAWATDSRVVCMRPELKNVRFCAPEETTGTHICGSVRLDGSVAEAAGLEWPERSDFANFSCPTLTSSQWPHYTWQICRSTFEEFDSFANMGIQWSLYNITKKTTMELIWNRGMMGVGGLVSSTAINGTVSRPVSTKNGPWTEQSFYLKYQSEYEEEQEEKEEKFSFNMTMCARFSGLADSITQLNISATSSSNRTEPNYISKVEDGAFDTRAVRRQLGAFKDASYIPPEERQILSISRQSLESSVAEARDGAAWQKYTWGGLMSTMFNESRQPRRIALCPHCSSVGKKSTDTDVIYPRLFLATMNETGSPARALQAIYFTYARVQYYNLIAAFKPNTAVPGATTAQIVTFKSTPVPKHFRGYWGAMGILAIFLATFTAAAALFRSTRFSLPGNIWHAVAQVSESAELSGVLREARLINDDEVERLIKEASTLPSNSPHSADSYVKDILRKFRKRISALASLFTSQPLRTTSRFVVREGVFVRASGVEASMEMEASESRQRLVRKNSGRESLNRGHVD